jgi:hypothetical protein
MTKQEAIDYMVKRGYTPDPGARIVFKEVDYSNNPLAPEKTCYKISFNARGVRVKFAIYPNTVGFQGY